MNVKIFTELIEEGARHQVYEMAKLYDKEVIRRYFFFRDKTSKTLYGRSI